MTNLESVIDDILRQMYDEAEPGLDWDYVLENPGEFQGEWYKEHYLDGQRQDEIVEEHTEGLSESEKTAVTMEAILNYGPRSTPKDNES